MAKRIGQWQADDGTNFDSKAEAEGYDSIVKFEEEFGIDVTDDLKEFLNLRAIKAKYFPPKPRAKKSE